MVAGQDLFYSVGMSGKMKGKNTCHDEKKGTLGFRKYSTYYRVIYENHKLGRPYCRLLVPP